MKAVITGASRGIGYAIAEKLATEGFDLILCSRNHNDLEKVQKDFSEKYSINVIFQEADLSKIEEVEKFSEFVLANTNELDVLVNNVGHYIDGDIFDGGTDLLQQQLNLNLVSVHELTRTLYPIFQKQGKGHIFTLGSILSVELRDEAAFYTISKHALRTWHQLLNNKAREDGIKSTLLLPSSTYTSSWEKVNVDKNLMIEASEVAQILWNCLDSKTETLVDEVLIKPLSKKYG